MPLAAAKIYLKVIGIENKSAQHISVEDIESFGIEGAGTWELLDNWIQYWDSKCKGRFGNDKDDLTILMFELTNMGSAGAGRRAWNERCKGEATICRER